MRALFVFSCENHCNKKGADPRSDSSIYLFFHTYKLHVSLQGDGELLNMSACKNTP